MKHTDHISKSVLKRIAIDQLNEQGFFTRDSLIIAWCERNRSDDYCQKGERSPLENYIWENSTNPRFRFFKDAMRLVYKDMEAKGIQLEVTEEVIDTRFRAPQGRKPKIYRLPSSANPAERDIIMAA